MDLFLCTILYSENISHIFIYGIIKIFSMFSMFLYAMTNQDMMKLNF